MRTTVGADYQANLMGNPSSTGTGSYMSACYIAVSADTTTPASGDTALPSEVTSGSLVRAQASFAHTTGTTYYTLSHTFTSDQTITLAKIGVFNGTPYGTGTMVFETLLNTPASLISGDQVLITETVNL